MGAELLERHLFEFADFFIDALSFAGDHLVARGGSALVRLCGLLRRASALLLELLNDGFRGGLFRAGLRAGRGPGGYFLEDHLDVLDILRGTVSEVDRSGGIDPTIDIRAGYREPAQRQ